MGNKRGKKPALPNPAPIAPLSQFLNIKGRIPFNKITSGRNVHPTENIYKEIYNDINIDNFVIENLVEVTNPYLKRSFELKRAEKMEKCGRKRAKSRLLYHGTCRDNVDEIFEENFKWWMYGKHRFGRGVNFSASIKYASNYGDESYHRIMIIADVFLNKYTIGNREMYLPAEGCDATVRNKKLDVVVKYDDAEFLPIYKMYYHIDDTKNTKNIQ